MKKKLCNGLKYTNYQVKKKKMNKKKKKKCFKQ